MNYEALALSSRVGPWVDIDMAVFDRNSLAWLPHKAPIGARMCAARLANTKQWWLFSFAAPHEKVHMPTIGPFETWQQALTTLRLIT